MFKIFNTGRLLVLFLLFITASSAFADEAVFSNNASQAEVNADAASINSETKSDEPAVNNAVNKQPSSESFSNEKFKSAVNDLESAQVDIREQLASCKELVETKENELSNKKAELTILKKEYKALQKKIKNVDKMKKMLNNNID